MSYCEKHGERIWHPLGCTRCQWEESERKKADRRSFNRSGFQQRKRTELSSLKETAQAKLRILMLRRYCLGKVFVNCSTCFKPVLVSSPHITKVVHCGHYYPKGVYWELAYEDENHAPQCYDCNCNKKEIIPAMRVFLVREWGEELITSLDRRAEDFTLRRKMGIISDQPDELFLRGKIIILNQRIKLSA